MGGGGLVINYSAHVGSLFLWRIYCATAVHHTPQDALPNKKNRPVGGGELTLVFLMHLIMITDLHICGLQFS